MFGTYFLISVSISAVILLIAALNPLLRRHCTAKCRYAVWIVAAVMLIIPFKLNFSHQIELNMSDVSAPYVNETTNSPETHVQPADLPIQTETTVDISFIVNALWIIGAITFMLYFIIGYALFCRKLKPFCTEIKEYGSKPRIMRCKIIKSPMLIGFFKPQILLPENPADIDFALRHERTHYKRGDLWINLLFTVANALHWFNPLIYVMRHLAKRDMEYSCDEIVVKDLNIDMRKEYSQSILQCASDTGASLGTCFKNDKENLKQRISSILSPAKKRSGTAVFITAVLCLLLCSGLIGCSDNVEVTTRPRIMYADDDTRIWFDEGSADYDGTVKVKCKVESILYNGEEQLEESLKQCVVYYNERLGLFHTCVKGKTHENADITIQPYGIPETPDAVPYSDIVRNENGYYGQFIYWVTENRQTQTHEPFYGQVTFDENGGITIRSDDDKYIIRLKITE